MADDQKIENLLNLALGATGEAKISGINGRV